MHPENVIGARMRPRLKSGPGFHGLPAQAIIKDMNLHELEQLAGPPGRGTYVGRQLCAADGQPSVADVGEAQIDLDRRRRCGFPEVVFAEGKTVAAMEKIFAGPDAARSRRAGHADVGRTGGRTAPAVSRRPTTTRVGRTFRIPAAGRARGGRRRAGRVAIVTAGTSDLPVAEEARETALWTGAE